MASLVAALLGLAVGTLISEDLTLLGAAVAIAEGRLPAWPAMAACAGGLFVGDVGLLCAGRLGRRPLARWQAAGVVDSLVTWVDRAPVLAVFASRVLPGARLPMYVAAGAWGRRPRVVIGAMLAAALVWTPLCIGLVIAVGRLLGAAPDASPALVWAFRGLAVATSVILVFLARRRSGADPRAVGARLERVLRWEFWPAWIVNAPVVAWVAVLAIRHRSLTLFTAANPGMPEGGLVGESKSAILASLPASWVLPWLVVPAGAPESRLELARQALDARGWSWPLVAKPDVGQRGAAVRWIRSDSDLVTYLAAVPDDVVLQVPHDGPYEAGLYYERSPGEERGRLTSITDKQFPEVIGDGCSTLGTLIARHPRYRLQSRLLQARHAARLDEMPRTGQVVRLGKVGNHAQGAVFRNGAHLWTAALEAQVDAIARRVPGFHLGRFDVRYGDREAFMAGRDLAIVELNGVAAEPTHIYDPDASLVGAWRSLARHWTTAFAFGAANRRRGCQPASFARLCALLWEHARSTPATIVSD